MTAERGGAALDRRFRQKLLRAIIAANALGGLLVLLFMGNALERVTAS